MKTPRLTIRDRGTKTLTIDQILPVDALAGLRQLPAKSVDCVMTSPPYWRMRDYGTRAILWPDGIRAVLGMEDLIEAYLDHLACVFQEVYRVLKDGGTLWINIGDVFAQARSQNRRAKVGAQNAREILPKSLCMIPGRLALRLIASGWILRNDIIWHKPNHMPCGVKDRFSCAWEHLLFFVKSNRYYFDLDGVRVRSSYSATCKLLPATLRLRKLGGRQGRLPPRGNEIGGSNPKGKNPGDCWSIQTELRSMATILGLTDQIQRRTPLLRHGAIYPEALCWRPIVAGCPPGGVVLDPFAGSGTTAWVAKCLGRKYLGFEQNPEFARLAQLRLARDVPDCPSDRNTENQERGI